MKKQTWVVAATAAWILGSPVLAQADKMQAFGALSKGQWAAALPGLRRMADAGDAQAQTTLATMYWRGIPGAVPQDRTTALDYYQRAAAKMNGEALAALGNAYLQGNGLPRDYKKAFDNLSKAVNLGVAHGKIGLSICYLKGWGTDQDLQKAFQLTKEAAFQKVPGAANNLAYFYRKGIGTAVNEPEANSWYAKAAPGLVSEARQWPDAFEHKIVLGEIYSNGWGVKKDPAVGAAWFKQGVPQLKKAAESGKTNAYLMLAELMDNGWGVPKDHAGAEGWYKKAIVAGDQEADFLYSREKQQQQPAASESPTPTP